MLQFLSMLNSFVAVCHYCDSDERTTTLGLLSSTQFNFNHRLHYNDVIMSMTASQITSLTIVYSAKKTPSSASLAFVREFTGTGEFLAQKAIDVENVSIWWRHHGIGYYTPTAISQTTFANAFSCMKSFIFTFKFYLSLFLRDNNPALMLIMARRRIHEKPLSQTMLTRFPDAYMRHQGEMN